MRKVFFWTHLAVGVAAGLVIGTMAITGSILAFEPQLVEWAERDVRFITPPPETSRLPIEQIIAAAQSSKPKAKVTGVSVKSDPTATTVVMFGRDGGLFVNPYTAQVMGGASKLHDFMHWVEDIHRFLGSRDIGKPITGAACLMFFGLLLTGVYLWWPRHWSVKSLKAITLLSWKGHGRARHWNWHNVIGFWLSPVILLTTLTGIIMSYGWATRLLYIAAGSTPPPLTTPSPQRGRGQGEGVNANIPLLLSRAQEKVPAWKAISLRLPNKAGAPAAAHIEVPAPEKFPQRSQLSMDPMTGEEKKWEPYEEQSRGRRWRTWARYLHTGEALGIPGQILMFIGALGAVVLVYTGFMMAWRRLRK